MGAPTPRSRALVPFRSGVLYRLAGSLGGAPQGVWDMGGGAPVGFPAQPPPSLPPGMGTLMGEEEEV